MSSGFGVLSSSLQWVSKPHVYCSLCLLSLYIVICHIISCFTQSFSFRYLVPQNNIPNILYDIWTHYYKFEKLLTEYILYVGLLNKCIFFLHAYHSPSITLSISLICLLKKSHPCISWHPSPLMIIPQSKLNAQEKTEWINYGIFICLVLCSCCKQLDRSTFITLEMSMIS